ncbi:MAG: hypothetical protein U5Q03_19780 [Bacteroidota bacterium]|nr:hypothetical protein [Bacteroidota bacterium]
MTSPLDFEKFDNGLGSSGVTSRTSLNPRYLRSGRGKFRAVGEQKLHHTFDYLRFGSRRQTNGSTFTTNREEFREVRLQKYHIIDTWKLNGLETENDVWRLELSVQRRTPTKSSTNKPEKQNNTPWKIFSTLKCSNCFT